MSQSEGDTSGISAESISGAAISGNANAHRDLIGRDTAGNMVSITQGDQFSQIILHLVHIRHDVSNTRQDVTNLDVKLDRTKESLSDQIENLRHSNEALRVGQTAVQADVNGLKTDVNSLRLRVDANQIASERLGQEAKTQREENKREISALREEMKKLGETSMNTQSSVRIRTQLQLWIVGLGVAIIVMWNIIQGILNRLSQWML